jgi:hypothetical protein
MLANQFKEKYVNILATATAGVDGKNVMFPDYKPFIVSCPADMKLTWLATGKGGAAKQKEHFCYCCLMTSDQINKANKDPCSLCSQPSQIDDEIPFADVQRECLHQEFITPDLLQRLRLQMLSAISEGVHATHSYVTKKSKLLLFEDDTDVHKHSNIFSIDYEADTLHSLELYHTFLLE